MVNTFVPKSNFREIAGYFLLISMVGLVLVSGFILFKFALPRPQFSYVGQIEQFRGNEPVRLVIQEGERVFYLWVVNLDGEIKVFDARATHPTSRDWNCQIEWFADPYPWLEKKYYFLDPCLGGAWSVDGSYLYGPSPRALDWYKTEHRDGELWIDTMYPQERASRPK
jgi:hypothetical protein